MMNMEKIKGGATIWARKTIDSIIFYDKPDKWFKIWFFVVNRVNHKDFRRWKRGQSFMTYSEIMEKTQATKAQVDMCFRFLKKSEMLTTQKTTRGMTVNILNYSFYQDLDNYKNDTENEVETKQKRQRNDTINKNDNNDKNENNATASVAKGKTFNILGEEIIKALETVDPKNKNYYGNKTQRKACDDLLGEYGLDKILQVIGFLPRANKLPYAPIITSPYELWERWTKLESFLQKKKGEIINKGKGLA